MTMIYRFRTIDVEQIRKLSTRLSIAFCARESRRQRVVGRWCGGWLVEAALPARAIPAIAWTLT
jgi:hypothetical protein